MSKIDENKIRKLIDSKDLANTQLVFELIKNDKNLYSKFFRYNVFPNEKGRLIYSLKQDGSDLCLFQTNNFGSSKQFKDVSIIKKLRDYD